MHKISLLCLLLVTVAAFPAPEEAPPKIETPKPEVTKADAVKQETTTKAATTNKQVEPKLELSKVTASIQEVTTKPTTKKPGTTTPQAAKDQVTQKEPEKKQEAPKKTPREGQIVGEFVASSGSRPATLNSQASELEVLSQPIQILRSSSGQRNLGRSSRQNQNDAASTSIQRTLNPIQRMLQNIFQPQPVVDTIREEDKYGNTGQNFDRIGRGIVSGTEALSRVLNSVIDYPFTMFRSAVGYATDALNNVGNRLVGL